MTLTNGIPMLNLLKTPHTIGYTVALIIIAFLFINRPTEYVPIEYEEDISLRDTTIVYKTKVDTLIQRDTVFTQLEIPTLTTNDSTKTYTTNYADSAITATITSRVKGELLDQSLWYISKIDYYVDTRYKTLTIDRYLKPTRIFEDPNRNNPKGLWGGISAENLSEDITFTPSVILLRGNIGYEVGYNLNDQSLSEFDLSALRVGIKFKIF